MSSPLSPLSPRARELAIEQLSALFANDDLTLEELERRIEGVYKATTVAELDRVTADLGQGLVARPASAHAPARVADPAALAPVYGRERGRMLSIMGESKRLGRWTVPQRLDVLAIMSDMRLDLTQAVLPPGIVDIDVRVVWAALRVIVPPGMRVVNQMHSIMASVHSSTDDLSSVAGVGGGPIIRLTGLALMGEVKIVVRRREDPYGLDDDDDD
jgi:hypothetical protein